MQSYLNWQSGSLPECVLVLAAGTCLIVVLAALAGRWLAAPVWQRTIWQAATLALLGSLAIEATGTGTGLVRLCRAPASRGPAEVPTPSSSVSQVALGQAVFGAPVASDRFETIVDQQADDPAPSAAFVPAAELPDGDAVQFAEDDPGSVLAVDQAAAAASDAMITTTTTLPSTARQQPIATDGAEMERTSGRAAPIALVWALGTTLLLARMLRGRLRLWLFRRRCVEVRQLAVCCRVVALARSMGLRRPVRLLASVGLDTPVSFGTVRPAIALPSTFSDDFTWPQQEAMLAHELAHLAAGDPLWHSVAGVMCAALWWHPLAWFARRRLRAASEAAADEASLLLPDGPSVLAATLVALGKRLARPQRLGWQAVAGHGFRSGLGRRVEGLLALRTGQRQAPGHRRLVLTKTALPVAMVLVAISCTAWAQPQVPLTEGGTTMNVFRTSWRCSLAAALWTMLGSSPVNAVADNATADAAKPATVETAQAEQGTQVAQPEQEGDKKDGGAGATEAVKPNEKTQVAGDVTSTSDDAAQMTQLLQKFNALRQRDEAQFRALEGQQKAIDAYQKDLELRHKTLENQQKATAARAGERAKILEECRRQVAELMAAGNHAEAHRLQSEALKRLGELVADEQPRPRYVRPPQSGPPPEARVKELMAAAENLTAAGFPEQAANIMRLVEQVNAGAPPGGGSGSFSAVISGSGGTVRYGATTGGGGFGGGVAGGARGGGFGGGGMGGGFRGGYGGGGPGGGFGGGGPGSAQAGGFGGGMPDLRAEVQQMHQEMKELRDQLKELLDRDRGTPPRPPRM